MITPFGIKPKAIDLIRAIDETREIREKLPKTVCRHRGCCCRSGCPNMYYIEYLGLREGFIDRMENTWRAEFLIKCVRYYLLKQFEGDGSSKNPEQASPSILVGKWDLKPFVLSLSKDERAALQYPARIL